MFPIWLGSHAPFVRLLYGNYQIFKIQFAETLTTNYNFDKAGESLQWIIYSILYAGWYSQNHCLLHSWQFSITAWKKWNGISNPFQTFWTNFMPPCKEIPKYCTINESKKYNPNNYLDLSTHNNSIRPIALQCISTPSCLPHGRPLTWKDCICP